MILKEANVLSIPIIGLVNTHTFAKEEITYPIYGNDSSLKVVRFVTLLVASLIVKAYGTRTKLYRYTNVITPANKAKHKVIKKTKTFPTDGRKNMQYANKHLNTKTSAKFLVKRRYAH
jgi:ribosomal protein S2